MNALKRAQVKGRKYALKRRSKYQYNDMMKWARGWAARLERMAKDPARMLEPAIEKLERELQSQYRDREFTNSPYWDMTVRGYYKAIFKDIYKMRQLRFTENIVAVEAWNISETLLKIASLWEFLRRGEDQNVWWDYS